MHTPAKTAQIGRGYAKWNSTLKVGENLTGRRNYDQSGAKVADKPSLQRRVDHTDFRTRAV
jgi:hypothetical protein